jgi:cytoskeleton protein RodZ
VAAALRIDSDARRAYIALVLNSSMPNAPFGEHLKRERELRGVSLEEITVATRISVRFLQAMEAGQWGQLPGGVFNRGFIRTVARFLGLDEDNMLAEYALETNDRPQVSLSARDPDLPKRLLLLVMAATLLLVLLAGAWFTYRHYGTRIVAWYRSNASARPAMVTAPPAQNGVGSPAPSRKNVPQASGANQSPATDAPAAAPAQKPAQTVSLRLSVLAVKSAYLKIDADGKVVFDGPVKLGDTREFTARSTLNVSTSDSGAVRLQLNGRPQTLTGAPGEPGSVVLTPKDLPSPAPPGAGN